ncbi:MAG: hypothetical protein HQ542_06485 [Bacteroidia bacterium]|nr:hypothetical protein [Bacteroidia bacterium]
MMRYGIHQPREETPEMILAFMDKMNYPNVNSFIFKDSSSFFRCMRDSVFLSNTLGTLFFYNNRLLVNYKDTSKGQWPGGCFVRNLRNDTVYQTDSAYSFQSLMAHFVPLNEMTQIDTTNTDYIVVVTWARFLGKYNERLFNIKEAIKENPAINVKAVFVCIDIQKEWNLTDKEKNALRFE